MNDKTFLIGLFAGMIISMIVSIVVGLRKSRKRNARHCRFDGEKITNNNGFGRLLLIQADVVNAIKQLGIRFTVTRKPLKKIKADRTLYICDINQGYAYYMYQDVKFGFCTSGLKEFFGCVPTKIYAYQGWV